MSAMPEANDPQEKIVAKACDHLADLLGYKVIRMDQRRASKVHQGLPDRRYQGERGAVFFEIKRPTGRLTREQSRFLEAELDAGCLASCGGLAELKDLFTAMRRATPVYARTLCRQQVDAWKGNGYRGERKGTT